MTPQIQALLDEKARKIEELEKCDSKRKAFVIAGISTLGLTAVGIGGNIALASKNKKLDAELSDRKAELSSKQGELSGLRQRQREDQDKKNREDCDAKGEGYTFEGGECKKKENPLPAPIELELNCMANVYAIANKNSITFADLDEKCKNNGGTGLVVARQGVYKCDGLEQTAFCDVEPVVIRSRDECKSNGKTGKLKVDTKGTIDCLDAKGKQTKCVCDVPVVKPTPSPTPNPDPKPNLKPDDTDSSNCVKSGGEWKPDLNQCYCGYNQTSTDKHMMQTQGLKTCVCQPDYVPIDTNDLSKGCRSGSDQAALDKVIYAIDTTLHNKWLKLDSALSSLKIMVGNMDAISDPEKADKAMLDIQDKGADVYELAADAQNAYTAAIAEYDKLSDSDKRKVASHKEGADQRYKDISAAMNKAQQLSASAQTKYNRIVAEAKKTADSPQAKKCDQTGGKWETSFCRCDKRNKGLVGDISLTWCKCEKPGEEYSKSEDKCMPTVANVQTKSATTQTFTE
jgi:hypothetical protein